LGGELLDKQRLLFCRSFLTSNFFLVGILLLFKLVRQQLKLKKQLFCDFS
jgi:hypothetical protein